MLMRLGSVLRIIAWGQAAEVRASSASVLRGVRPFSDLRVYDVTYLWLGWLRAVKTSTEVRRCKLELAHSCLIGLQPGRGFEHLNVCKIEGTCADFRPCFCYCRKFVCGFA
jgi:hypothetical protein